jgi:hypothetical protein
MLPTEDLFVYVYVMVDDAITSGAVVIPRRPGPAPACSDGELLAIALVRHLLGRRSEAGFLAEVARDWAYLFPRLPRQSEANRRIRWLWGALEQFRGALAGRLPEDDCQQIDTSALPVKHASRVRGPDGWTGPNGLAARFGRDAAHAEWCRRPGRDRADLRAAALGGAVVQAGQGRARLGRLPGPLRYRDPPPPGAGQLRLLLLLARRPAPTRAGPGKPSREGAPPPSPSSPGHARSSLRYQAGPVHCAPSAAG